MHKFKIIQVEQKYRERKALLNGLFIAFKIHHGFESSFERVDI
jgi:hypothetical protein